MGLFDRPDDPTAEPPPTPGIDIPTIMDGLSAFAEINAGQVATLVQQGFTRHQASEIVVAFNQQSAAHAWAAVGRMWGLTDPEAKS